MPEPRAAVDPGIEGTPKEQLLNREQLFLKQNIGDVIPYLLYGR